MIMFPAKPVQVCLELEYFPVQLCLMETSQFDQHAMAFFLAYLVCRRHLLYFLWQVKYLWG